MQPLGEINGRDTGAFVVHAGITDELITQLVIASNKDDDTALKTFTGDSRRFVTESTMQKWLEDTARKVYVLTPIGQQDRLAGFAWLRPDGCVHALDSIENTNLGERYTQTGGIGVHTVASRIYSEYRGQKLATPFMEVVQRDYMQKVGGNVAAILADIHQDNITSQKLFMRLGYQLLGFQRERTLWILDHANTPQLIEPDESSILL